MEYFEDEWASKKVGSGSTAIYASIGRSLHALSLLIYGCSLFLLENFHSEGTAEFWGWVLGLLYKVAGLFGKILGWFFFLSKISLILQNCYL